MRRWVWARDGSRVPVACLSVPRGVLFRVEWPGEDVCARYTVVRGFPWMGCYESHYLEKIVDYLKPKPQAGGASDREFEVEDQTFAKAFPALYAHLAQLRWPTGAPRAKLCKLSLFCEGGRWKAFLNDPSDDTFLPCEADSFGELLKAVEARLCEDKPGWRVNQWAARGKKGK